MLAPDWSFWLGIVGCLVSICLAAIGMALSELTLGSLRKLEITDPKLAETFKGWLDRRDLYRISIRIAHVAVVLFIIYCATAYAVQTSTTLLALFPHLLLLALSYLVVSECLGFDLSHLGSRFLLRTLMPVVSVLTVLCLPLSYPLVRWHRFVVHRQQGAHNGDEKATAEDEIMSLVEYDESVESGQAELEADERRMIKGVFHLDETLVREIMTPRVDIQAVEDTASPADAKAKIARSGHTRIPVFHESIDHVAGILHAKDLMEDERLAETEALTDLTSPASFIPETKNIGDLLEEFQQMVTQLAIVVDEYGGTAGVVTLEDIIEEIVGEIHDEYELIEGEPTIRHLPDGGVIVNARTPIRELNEKLNLEILEEEEYDTLGGFVSYAFGRIPDKGEVLETEHFHLEILSADPRRILKAKLVRKGRPGEEKPGRNGEESG